MTDEGQVGGPPPDNAPEGSLTDTVKRVIESSLSFAEAEIAKQKLRATLIATGVRDITILVVTALMLLPAVIFALLIGVIIGLAPSLGIWGSTGVVGGGTALALALLLLLARLRLKRLMQDAEL